MTLELISRLPKTSTDKPPLLFLHGMGFGAWCWDEHFLSWFASKGYPAHAMSLRGHGQNPALDNLRWQKLDRYIEDLTQIYEGFDQPPILVGHSMGGFIVQKFLAADAFNQVSKSAKPPAVILLSSTPSNGTLSIALKTAWRFPRQSLKVLWKGSARPLLDQAGIFQKTLLSDDVPIENVKRYSAMTGDESLIAFASMMFSSSPKRHENPPPMLVISAQNDVYIPEQDSRNTALYYKADYKTIPNLAHLVMLDTNWEDCAKGILSWLKQQHFEKKNHSQNR